MTSSSSASTKRAIRPPSDANPSASAPGRPCKGDPAPNDEAPQAGSKAGGPEVDWGVFPSRTVTVVRPYREGLRGRVFSVLSDAGLDMVGAEIIESETSDSEVLARLRGCPADVLLIPFHAHRSAKGHELNGLDLCERIEKELPELRKTPILMPASGAALPGIWLRFSAMTRQPVSDPLKKRILLIEEEQLAQPEIVSQIVQHLDSMEK